MKLCRRPWGLLTRRGRDCVAAGRTTMEGIEKQITEALGEGGHAQLVRLLRRLLKAGQESHRSLVEAPIRGHDGLNLWDAE